jgi:hypothetical protein
VAFLLLFSLERTVNYNMAMIYDLDNEGGGHIISDSDTGAPALTITSNAAGYPALSLISCISASPLQITAAGAPVKFESGGSAPAALEVESYAAGYPALIVASTASGYPVDVTAINETYGARFRSCVTGGVAVIVGRTVVGSPTVAPFKVLHPSVASGAVMEFGGGFISCTSVDIVTAANSDYVLPISLGGVVRYIPLVNGTAIKGGAAVS